MIPSAVRSDGADTGAVRTDTIEADGTDLTVIHGGLCAPGMERDVFVRHLITTRDRLRAGVRKLKAEGEDALRQLDAARAEAREARALLSAAEAAAEQERAELGARAAADLADLRAEHEQDMAALRSEFEGRLQQAAEDLSVAQQSVRDLRLDLGREKRTAYDTAVATLRPAHLKEVAKYRQIGKKAGVAVTMAYLEASKAEGGDLGRVSELASRVLIKGAEAFGAREAENADSERREAAAEASRA